MSDPSYRLGVDIGGTFTDVVLVRDDGVVLAAKVLSTPDDYARGVVEGAAALRDAEIESVAIALLHSYVDDEHERRVEEIVRTVVGDGVYVTRSAEILPEIREYERTSTAVVNAYVGPAITRYVRSLVDRLHEAGIGAQLEVMQSAGGTVDPATALRK